MKVNISSNANPFLTGLVFGFDVGTGSIGYAVRQGTDFKDVGVLICPEDTSDLSGRRGLRSQRRRLRNRWHIHDWLIKQLEEKMGLPSPWMKTDGQIILKPGLDYSRISNPVRLRFEALEGRIEKPEELHAAIVHLWKRRGKTEVPWKQGEAKPETLEQKKELKKIEKKLDDLKNEMAAGDGAKNPDGTPKAFHHPCQLLIHRQKLGIKQRDEVWPRDEFQNPTFNLKNEFLAIIEKVTVLKNEKGEMLPKLSKKTVTFENDEKQNQTVPAADWILYGETRTVIKKGQKRHVYFKTTECENPGVLGLRWPRFDNRSPGLDLLNPLDELDRPIHVVRRNKPVFRETQFEQAIFNFRVIEKATGKKVLPDIASLNRLREIYESAKQNPKRKSKKPKKDSASAGKNEVVEVKIGDGLLNTWIKDFSHKYELIKDSPELISRTGDGRAKFSSATLRDIKHILETLSAGQTVDAIQPLLRIPNKESKERAMNRFLGDIKHGLVRHRLGLFLRLIRELTAKHGKPNFVVVEAVRSLAFSTKKLEKHKQEQRENRNKRDQIYKKLKSEEQSTSKNAILRYRLAEEAGFECPFCRCPFCLENVLVQDADIAHLYPQSLTPCNEFYNLTIAHTRCNRTDMEAKIPREAFGHDKKLWADIEANARNRFKGKKLQLFLAQTREEAEKLIESKTPLTATAYIAKMIRRLCLIDLEWLGEDGRDPTKEDGNIPSKQFLVSNGEITARYREAWQLNEILHAPIPTYSQAEWNNLSPQEKQAHKEARNRRFEKNRGDHRHHALDAMVISCTWPAYAQRVHNATKDWQDKGWWYFDSLKKRLMARHPLFEDFAPMRKAADDWMKRLIEENRIRHHSTRTKHKQGYELDRLGKKAPNVYVSREKVEKLSPPSDFDFTYNPKTIEKEAGNDKKLWPYLRAAWQIYKAELSADELTSKIAEASGSFPNDFAERLCLDHAKKWKSTAKKNIPFSWPEQISKPVRDGKGANDFDRIYCTVEGKMSDTLAKYFHVAWNRYKSATPDYREKLKLTDGKLPPDFVERLCFAHFQGWRHRGCPEEFKLPKKEEVKIPIRSVSYRSQNNDSTVMLTDKKCKAYVVRKLYRYVSVWKAKDSADYAIEFVPTWKNDNRVYKRIISGSANGDLTWEDNKAQPLIAYNLGQHKEVARVFTGDVVRAKKIDAPFRFYRVLDKGQTQVTLLPTHVAKDKSGAAQIAFGVKKSGVKLNWPVFISEYELPHPPSVKPQPAGSTEA
jgi:hypothetical protein